MTAMKKQTIKSVLMSLIDRPVLPDRITIDAEHIKDLAASIAEVGLITPILLNPVGGRYEIVAGDCRYQAFLSLGRQEIPAIIQELNSEAVSILRATENLQRKNLTVIEEANIYKTLHNVHNLDWDQIGKRCGKSPALVKRRYDLLKMPQILIDALHEKKITYSVAEELFALSSVSKIEYYLGYCVDHGATKEVVRGWVKEEKSIERQNESAGVGGGWGSALPEQKPVYVSCDVCKGPSELTKIIGLRICPDCHSTIKNNM